MDKSEFQQILRKYLSGRATEEEKAIIDLWYERMDDDSGGLIRDDEERMQARYWDKILAYIRSTAHFMGLRPSLIGIAAALGVLMVSFLHLYGAGWWSAPEASQLRYSDMNRVVNVGAVPQEVILPDGSQVILEPQSRIRYASDFTGEDRRVYLSGKAFFDVIHRPDQPFKVITREVITRVLGTSFTVSAFRWDSDVVVSVVTGKVSVYRKDAEEEAVGHEVVLSPNQEFVYHKEEKIVNTTIVREPVAIVPAEEVKRMRFEDTSPKIVFEAIEKVYGVDIEFDEEKFSACRITTNISDGNILNRLHIICEVINATYRLEGTMIVIEGEGCLAIDSSI